MVAHLPSVHKALGSIPSTRKPKTKKPQITNVGAWNPTLNKTTIKDTYEKNSQKYQTRYLIDY